MALFQKKSHGRRMQLLTITRIARKESYPCSLLERYADHAKIQHLVLRVGEFQVMKFMTAQIEPFPHMSPPRGPLAGNDLVVTSLG